MGENTSGNGQRMPGEPDFSDGGREAAQNPGASAGASGANADANANGNVGGGTEARKIGREHIHWNGEQGTPQYPATHAGSPVQPGARPTGLEDNQTQQIQAQHIQPQQMQPQQAQSQPFQSQPAQSQLQSQPQQDPQFSVPPAQPGMQGLSSTPVQEPHQDPLVPQDPMAPQPREKKRWSTPAVAALLLTGAVVASAVTYVGMDALNENKSSNNATTSFDSSNTTNKSAKEKEASNPVEPGSTSDVANKVLPSVVSIRVTTSQGGDEGSGSIISSDGLILTNNHVVSAAEGGKAKMEVALNDGRTLEAEVVATDPQTDIAVIKAKNVTDLKPIEFGDSNAVNVGEDVMAIGSPLGLSATVTTGIVSAKNRPVQASGEDGGEASLIDAIQTDASINPGNSGGALVDMQGKLIGIPSVIASTGGESAGSIGLGFAIPINQAERISKQLIDKGKAEHPIIGAKVNTRSNEVGAVVVDVNKDSPADKAGLKKGDLVTHVDERRVDSGVALIAAIRSHAVGDTVKLKVKEGRDGEEREVELTLTTAE